MALAEWVSYKAAEWNHEDNAARNRETERSNKANERIKEAQLAWEKEKFPTEQETSRYGAYYRGLGAKEYEATSIVPQQLSTQVKLREMDVQSNQLIASARIASDVGIAQLGAQTSRANVLDQTRTNLQVAGINAAVGYAGQAVSAANVEKQVNVSRENVLTQTSTQADIASKDRAVDIERMKTDLTVAGINAVGNFGGKVVGGLLGLAGK